MKSTLLEEFLDYIKDKRLKLYWGSRARRIIILMFSFQKKKKLSNDECLDILKELGNILEFNYQEPYLTLPELFKASFLKPKRVKTKYKIIKEDIL